MRSVSEALALIQERLSPLPVDDIDFGTATGRRLAAPIVSDVDSPPFDKSLMDGFAIIAQDSTSSPRSLELLEQVTAGQVPTRSVASGQAIQVMTGAPLPEGADVVIPVEQTETGDEGTIRILDEVKPGANLIRKGGSMREGETIFPEEHALRPQDLSLLAELGQTRISSRRLPRVAVLATGDELVPPDRTPGPGQIRNSNETLLVSLIRANGCEAVPLGIARDTPEDLRSKIEQGLDCDVLLLSGGVSAGVHDLVPHALRDSGVVEVFHKVRLKPGKPIWFGERPVGSERCNLVFGLPGNPVSTLVCFELFVVTALRGLLGLRETAPAGFHAKLMGPLASRGQRRVYFPAYLSISERGKLRAEPVTWAGSSDLRSTARANGMVMLEADQEAAAGDVVPALLWSGNSIIAG